MLIRSVVAPFLARGDTATPVKAALTGTAVNIAFKIALMGPLAQVGLALATSIGAWINFILVLWFAGRAGLIAADATLKSSLGQARGGRRCFRGLASDRVAPSSHRCYRRCPGSATESELLVLAVLGGARLRRACRSRCSAGAGCR